MTADRGPLPLAVFDIDGVVADVRHRLRYVGQRPKDWPAFFRAAADDPPLVEGVRLVQRYAEDHEVVWLTGRPRHLAAATRDWLQRQDLPLGQLLMRPDRDFRPARAVKVQLLRDLAGGTRPVAVVVDDDPQVVAAMREAGWHALLADWVPREEPLREAQETEGRT